MSNDVILELKSAIKDLKIEIMHKQEELESLVEKYRELTGEEIED